MSRGWQQLFNDRVDEIDNVDDDRLEQARYVASGSFRDVWMIRDYDGTTKRALKTLRWCETCHYDLRNMDRHRRDAVAFDQLTASDLVVNTYGYCVNSGLFDWGEGGDLTRIFERDDGNNISKETLLHIAYNVSMSLAHAHHFDEQGRPTIAHTDIKVNQFLYQGGYYQLTDFNRVRFLLWNKDENSQCGFMVGKNGGAWRSPEEYAYEEETEKVDVYSLGNILFFLLVRHNPWEGYKSGKVAELVKSQVRPPLPKDIVESTDIYEKYMLKAINMAFTYNKTQRPNAVEIAKKLQEGIGKLEKQR
jgi:serine/threonine protein kinase